MKFLLTLDPSDIAYCLPVEVHLSRPYHDGYARFTPHSPHTSNEALPQTDEVYQLARVV